MTGMEPTDGQRKETDKAGFIAQNVVPENYPFLLVSDLQEKNMCSDLI